MYPPTASIRYFFEVYGSIEYIHCIGIGNCEISGRKNIQTFKFSKFSNIKHSLIKRQLEEQKIDDVKNSRTIILSFIVFKKIFHLFFQSLGLFFSTPRVLEQVMSNSEINTECCFPLKTNHKLLGQNIKVPSLVLKDSIQPNPRKTLLFI